VNDVSVASFVNIKQGDIAVESILQGTAFCGLFSFCKWIGAQMPITPKYAGVLM